MHRVWTLNRKKDKNCKVLAALKEALEPRAIVHATNDVHMTLNKESQNQQDATLKVAREASRKKAKILVQEANQSMSVNNG